MIKIHARKSSCASSRRRGSILVVALMVVIGVAMLGACLLQFTISLTRNQVQDVDNKRAFYVAEAGLSEGIYGLKAGGSGNIASSSAPARFGDGVLWVETTQTADGRLRVESNGLCGAGRASLSLVVEQKSSSTAALGVFSDGDLLVKRGSMIDSYDPGAQAEGGGLIGGLLGGGGGDQPSTTSGRVGSNGNIEVQGSTRSATIISGDVIPGPDGTVSSSNGVTITGSTTPRSEATSLPAVEVPLLASLGDLHQQGTTPMTLPAGEHRYGTLEVAENSQLVIAGPQTLVVGLLLLKQNAQLVLDTSAGDVVIYATDYVNFAKESLVNNTQQDPASARLLISAGESIDRTGDGIPDPSVSIQSRGQLYATVYAPDAEVALGNSLELFGAITSAKLGLSEGAKLHFDVGLLENDGTSKSTVELLSWRVLELPNVPIFNLRVDPLAALRLQGVNPTTPYAAHQNVNFKIQYTSPTGEVLAWAGDELKFDWAKVQAVTKTTRVGDADFDSGLTGLVGSLAGGLLRGI